MAFVKVGDPQPIIKTHDADVTDEETKKALKEAKLAAQKEQAAKLGVTTEAQKSSEEGIA